MLMYMACRVISALLKFLSLSLKVARVYINFILFKVLIQMIFQYEIFA